MWFQDFANRLLLELQLPNKPLPRQKPTAETFSDTPLPAWNKQTEWSLRNDSNPSYYSLSYALH